MENHMGNNSTDVKIKVNTDLDRLHALGLKGDNYQEIKDSMDESLTYHGVCEDVVNADPGERREYEFLGKKFRMANGTASELILLKDRDRRFEELGNCQTVQDFYMECIKWEFEKELAGREPSADMWPEMLDWMRDSIYQEWEFGGPKRENLTDEKRKNEKDRIASYDDERVMTVWGAQTFFALRNVILFA